MRFLRYRTLLPTLRNQTTDKNFTRVEVPVTNRENLIKRSGFQKGDSAPYASHDVLAYPRTFQPWQLNYKGNGLFYGMFALVTFSYVMYEKDYLLRTGRQERPEKVYYRP